MSGNLRLFLTSAQDSLLIISKVNTRSVQFIDRKDGIVGAKIGAKIGAITGAIIRPVTRPGDSLRLLFPFYLLAMTGEGRKKLKKGVGSSQAKPSATPASASTSTSTTRTSTRGQKSPSTQSPSTQPSKPPSTRSQTTGSTKSQNQVIEKKSAKSAFTVKSTTAPATLTTPSTKVAKDEVKRTEIIANFQKSYVAGAEATEAKGKSGLPKPKRKSGKLYKPHL